MNTIDIRNALRKRYSDHRHYAVAEEVGITTGGGCRRLDMIVVDCFESTGFRLDGYEIKISTSDLRRELETPDKHIAFFDVLDYYSLVVPKGVVEPLMDIIPKTWGILIVEEDGTTRYRRKPLALADRTMYSPVPRGFLASIVRNIQTLQPSEIELREAYDKGFKDGKEKVEWQTRYERERLKEKAEKLDAYEKLQTRLGLWFKDQDKALDAFEAFQKLNIDFVIRELNDCEAQIARLKKVLANTQKEET